MFTGIFWNFLRRATTCNPKIKSSNSGLLSFFSDHLVYINPLNSYFFENIISKGFSETVVTINKREYQVEKSLPHIMLALVEITRDS